MNSLVYFFRFLYKLRYWLLICPAAVALIVMFNTRNMRKTYKVTTTIYTGVVSGYDIQSGVSERQDWNVINNAVDNLINIISSQTTLEHVSMRLFVQHLMYGDPNKDNNYIKASNYRNLVSRTPKEVLDLVDKTSEEKTLQNMYDYMTASSANYVYGLFNYSHRHYSYEALSKITVRRMGNSDMLEVAYVSDDPGITYNTIKILNDEFVKQYKELRFGETNNVIAYFEAELARTGQRLHDAEDSLTYYNVSKRIINYDEQTKHVASLSRDYELRYESILLDYNSSLRLMETLEDRIQEHVKYLRNNALFTDKLNTISDLSTKIALRESFVDTLTMDAGTDRLKYELGTARDELQDIIKNIGLQTYTKEGLSNESLVSQWLDVLISYEKAKAQLAVMEKRRVELDKQYVFFSPIGSTIKRKEREIDFTEQNYLSILRSLNDARLRQKSLQMSSATLKIINEPIFPIQTMPTKRKLMVAAAFFGTFFFIIFFFLILELLDRTLKNKIRAERLTSARVIGAFPAPGKFRYRSYTKAWQDIASRYLGNAMLEYFRPVTPNIINVVSVGDGDGKSMIAGKLAEYYGQMGLKVRYVVGGVDFSVEKKDFLLAQSLSEFIPEGYGDSDVIVVEYPSLEVCTVPAPVLREASCNLFIARADKTWKDADQVQLNKVTAQSGGAPLFLCLNYSAPDAVETFTGLLPPYTLMRKATFKFLQFGLSSGGK